MAYAIFRTAKLKGGSVRASDSHTERERETLNADPNRIENNFYLRGERGENLREKVTDVIKNAQARSGQKIRKDAVECVEFLMTASPEYFRDARTGGNDTIKEFEFYRKCDEHMTKLEERGFVFVKAVAHRDEQTPHIAAYAVPLDESGRLNCRSHFDGRDKLSAMQDEFADTMAPLGLERGIKGSVAAHEKVQRYYGKIEMLDAAYQEIERLREMQEQSRQMLETTTNLLDRQLQSRADVTLREAAEAFLKPERLLETSQGLAVLKQNEPDQILAIVTPDNKAFAATGEKMSDGSSVMFLTKTTGAPPDQILPAIESKFGAEQSERSARAYGDELAKKKYEAKERDFAEAAVEVELAAEEQQIQEDQISLGISM